PLAIPAVWPARASPARRLSRCTREGDGRRPARRGQIRLSREDRDPDPSRLTRDRADREKRYASVPTSCLFPVQGPDEPEALEGEPGVDTLDRARVRGDQLGEAARRDGRRVRTELAADPLDDRVHLAREAVDET